MTLVHHSAIVVTDVERSLTFWRDGIGLQETMNQGFDGDWISLFGAPANHLDSVFLGDPARPDAGVVELVSFQDLDAPEPAEPVGPPAPGFFLLSLYVDLEATAARLEKLGFPLGPRIEVPGLSGPVSMATVAAPDGVLVELIGLG